MIAFDNIKSHPSDKIKVTFNKESFELIVLDFNSKNYKLLIPKLFANIDTQKSKYILKNKYIVIKLYKGKSEHWNSLAF